MSRYAIQISGSGLNRVFYADLLHVQEEDGKVTIELVPVVPSAQLNYGEAVAVNLDPLFIQRMNELQIHWQQQPLPQQQQRRRPGLLRFRPWGVEDD